MSPPQVKKLLVDPGTAAAMLGLSRASLYKFIKSGRFGVKPVTFGKKVLYSTAELERYVDEGCPAKDIWETVRMNRKKGISKDVNAGS